MARLPIQERLLHYFLAMGAESEELAQGAAEGLTLALGSERVHVAILTDDMFLQKGKIMESVLKIASLKDTVNRLYLAAPRLLGTAVEAGIFRTHGIGLILFDDRRIEEIVPPQSFQPQRLEASDHIPDETLMNEIQTLKTMYAEMERNVATLRDDIRNYHEKASSLNVSPDKMPSRQVVRRDPSYISQSGDLPPFFSNNPWLEVLSRRGRDEGVSIAG